MARNVRRRKVITPKQKWIICYLGDNPNRWVPKSEIEQKYAEHKFNGIEIPNWYNIKMGTWNFVPLIRMGYIMKSKKGNYKSKKLYES